jgi:hypothetical protein
LRSLAKWPEQTEPLMEEQRRKLAQELAALPSGCSSGPKAFGAPPGRSRRAAGSCHSKILAQLMEKRVDMLQETMQKVMDPRGPSRIGANRSAGK